MATGHEALIGSPVRLYNEAYVTRFGLKTVRLSDQESLIHDTSNLDDLIDAYFREEQGGLPRNLSEYVAAAKLANPAIHFLLQGFMRINPEFCEQLRIVSAQRAEEYEKNQELRQRIDQGLTTWADLKPTGPSEKEEAFRSFLYSQVLDGIGDIAARHSMNFNLEELLE
jgi:hypothetical protein